MLIWCHIVTLSYVGIDLSKQITISHSHAWFDRDYLPSSSFLDYDKFHSRAAVQVDFDYSFLLWRIYYVFLMLGYCSHTNSWFVMHFTALHWIALHWIALHWIALHWIELHCIELNCIALHCIIWCVALHCMMLCNVLHSIRFWCVISCNGMLCVVLFCTVYHGVVSCHRVF